MNSHFIPSDRSGIPHTTLRAAIVAALIAIAPASILAHQPTQPTTAGGVADVSLADLDLSTAEGERLARDRLRTVAERICAVPGRVSSTQPAFGMCVDNTVTSALRQIEALTKTHTSVQMSAVRGASVSLADLNLSTLEGEQVARERLEAMARRLCGELARRSDLGYQASYPACVRDSVAGALAQADAIAAARNMRTAQRSAP